MGQARHADEDFLEDCISDVCAGDEAAAELEADIFPTESSLGAEQRSKGWFMIIITSCSTDLLRAVAQSCDSLFSLLQRVSVDFA